MASPGHPDRRFPAIVITWVKSRNRPSFAMFKPAETIAWERKRADRLYRGRVPVNVEHDDAGFVIFRNRWAEEETGAGPRTDRQWLDHIRARELPARAPRPPAAGAGLFADHPP